MEHMRGWQKMSLRLGHNDFVNPFEEILFNSSGNEKPLNTFKLRNLKVTLNWTHPNSTHLVSLWNCPSPGVPYSRNITIICADSYTRIICGTLNTKSSLPNSHAVTRLLVKCLYSPSVYPFFHCRHQFRWLLSVIWTVVAKNSPVSPKCANSPPIWYLHQSQIYSKCKPNPAVTMFKAYYYAMLLWWKAKTLKRAIWEPAEFGSCYLCQLFPPPSLGCSSSGLLSALQPWHVPPTPHTPLLHMCFLCLNYFPSLLPTPPLHCHLLRMPSADTPVLMFLFYQVCMFFSVIIWLYVFLMDSFFLSLLCSWLVT